MMKFTLDVKKQPNLHFYNLNPGDVFRWVNRESILMKTQGTLGEPGYIYLNDGSYFPVKDSSDEVVKLTHEGVIKFHDE